MIAKVGSRLANKESPGYFTKEMGALSIHPASELGGLGCGPYSRTFPVLIQFAIGLRRVDRLYPFD